MNAPQEVRERLCSVWVYNPVLKSYRAAGLYRDTPTRQLFVRLDGQWFSFESFDLIQTPRGSRELP